MRYAEWTLRWWMILCRILNDKQYINYWMMNVMYNIEGHWMIEWWMIYEVLNDGCYMKSGSINIIGNDECG